MKVEAILKKIPGTIYVGNPIANQQTDLKVSINKDKAGLLGVSIGEIDRTIRLGIAGLNIGTFSPVQGDDEVTINVTTPRGKFTTYEVFDKLYVNSVVGQAIPLRQLAKVEFETSPNLIRHYDKARFATVTAFVKSGYLYEAVNKSVIADLDKLKLPDGYRYPGCGRAREQTGIFWWYRDHCSHYHLWIHRGTGS